MPGFRFRQVSLSLFHFSLSLYIYIHTQREREGERERGREREAYISWHEECINTHKNLGERQLGHRVYQDDKSGAYLWLDLLSVDWCFQFNALTYLLLLRSASIRHRMRDSVSPSLVNAKCFNPCWTRFFILERTAFSLDRELHLGSLWRKSVIRGNKISWVFLTL